MTSGDRPGFAGFVARALVTLTIPQGYTLTIAGAGATDVFRFGALAPADVVAFLAGATGAFLAMSYLCQRVVQAPPEPPSSAWRLANAGPLVSVPAGMAVTFLVPWAWLACLLSAAVAVSVYVGFVAAHYVLLQRATAVTPSSVAVVLEARPPDALQVVAGDDGI